MCECFPGVQVTTTGPEFLNKYSEELKCFKLKIKLLICASMFYLIFFILTSNYYQNSYFHDLYLFIQYNSNYFFEHCLCQQKLSKNLGPGGAAAALKSPRQECECPGYGTSCMFSTHTCAHTPRRHRIADNLQSAAVLQEPLYGYAPPPNQNEVGSDRSK